MPRMFKSLSGTVNQIVRNLNKVANAAIDENLAVMADMNRDQLTFGINAEGEEVGQYQSEPYARLKKSIGARAPFGIPDLKLTGDFHSGIFVRRKGSELNFGSTDTKQSMLSEKYGESIFGLTTENRAEVTDNYIFPIITDWLSQQLKQI